MVAPLYNLPPNTDWCPPDALLFAAYLYRCWLDGEAAFKACREEASRAVA